MRFALHLTKTDITLVDATRYAGGGDNLYCDLCRQGVLWVRASSRASSHFRHKKRSDCVRTDDDPEDIVSQEPISLFNPMSDWHKCWSGSVHPTFRECLMHGKPRDGGCVDTNTILEFQHSPISFEEFQARCGPVKFALWIFDYTRSTMFQYSPVLPDKTKHLFVRCQTFGAYPWLSVKHVLVVIHGPDGKLYEMASHECFQFETLGYVYRLKQLSSKALQWIMYFMQEGKCPIFSFAAKTLTVVTNLNPLNDAACYYLDVLHRKLVTNHAIHSDLPLYVTAPAGSGKTTLLLDTCRKAPPSHSILIVTFNKANQQTMSLRCKQAGLKNVTCSTLDSLCYCAVKAFNGYAPLDLNSFVTDKWVIETFFPRCTPWHHKRNSKGIATILERVIRTALPRTRRLSMCDKHEEDYGWIADKAVKGEGAWMSTFPGLRFQSLVHELLQSLKPYDTVMVDEFQDLDVQALILILTIKSCMGKSKEPELVIRSRSSERKRQVKQEDREPNFIFVGDPMQTIYGFGKSDDCTECEALYAAKVEDMKTYLPSHTYQVKLFQSFRSPHHTMDYLSDVFPLAKGVSGLVERDDGSSIHFVKDWHECPEETLILVRSKQELVELFSKGYGSSVVGGKTIAGEMTSILRYGSKRNASCSPFAKFVLGMPSGKTTRLSKHLETASVTLDELCETGGGISTVHRVKGFEWDQVAIPLSLFQNSFCPDTTERNVAYVAMSRHRIGLWIVGDETTTKSKQSHTMHRTEETSPQKGYCLHCGGKLRQFSAGDWEGRRYHKKCWIEQRKETEW